MAHLTEVSTGRQLALEADYVIGRASLSSLRIPERYVSARHAVLRWSGNDWEIQDLGSRNGTFLDGRHVEPGAYVKVPLGAQLAFGRREQAYRLVDGSAPRIMAVRLRDAEAAVLEQELIAIPSQEDPSFTIYRASDGTWLLEQAASVTPIVDQQRFSAGGDTWKFCCPDLLSRTSLASLLTVDVQHLHLKFLVSRDEEYVELKVAGGQTTYDLGARSHHYLLLTLARRRLADERDGIPDGSAGWVYQEELSRDPSMAPPQLNLDVFRIRKQIAAVGILDGASIIERRPRTRQLRVGTKHISVEVL